VAIVLVEWRTGGTLAVVVEVSVLVSLRSSENQGVWSREAKKSRRAQHEQQQRQRRQQQQQQQQQQQ